MNICVQTLHGSSFVVIYQASETVEQLKTTIQNNQNFSKDPKFWKLYYQNRELTGNEKLTRAINGDRVYLDEDGYGKSTGQYREYRGIYHKRATLHEIEGEDGSIINPTQVIYDGVLYDFVGWDNFRYRLKKIDVEEEFTRPNWECVSLFRLDDLNWRFSQPLLAH